MCRKWNVDAFYPRVVDSSGRMTLSLIMAKSRVAPIKSKLKIQKLKRCGAALVIEILDNVLYLIRDNVQYDTLESIMAPVRGEGLFNGVPASPSQDIAVPVQTTLS
ncbi:hypothetical protein EVAR_80101_1 [Eumeta japonica]|uniref:Uncharacterized protein n=1 Tax=Eumeta variegata TaxID=151549 RepID=A0A4C1UCZ9_EUMVA|nr:hypothetical protein EVAR_80101_1 [Eumeta japonica]